MKIWFMFDNHTFARVGDSTTGREAMESRARELFAKDGCGSLFARDERDRHAANVNGTRQPDGRYGVTDAALAEFFDRVEEHANWLARG